MQLCTLRWIFGPGHFESESNCALELITDLRRLRPVSGQETIDREDVSCNVFDRRIFGVVRALGRRGNEPEDESSHRHNEPHRKLDGIPGFRTEMSLRQRDSESHTKHAAAQKACEYDRGYDHLDHRIQRLRITAISAATPSSAINAPTSAASDRGIRMPR